MNRGASDINERHMIEQVRAYSLIEGTLVKVIQEDGKAGMAQIRAAGAITFLQWPDEPVWATITTAWTKTGQAPGVLTFITANPNGAMEQHED
jgi:hypothetical protein